MYHLHNTEEGGGHEASDEKGETEDGENGGSVEVGLRDEWTSQGRENPLLFVFEGTSVGSTFCTFSFLGLER